MNGRFRFAAVLLTFIVVLATDRQFFRPWEPSIANKYPCPAVRLPASEVTLPPKSHTSEEKSYQLPDGTTVRQIEFTNSEEEPDLLILTLVKDASSYGHDKGRPMRTLQDYIELLISSELNLTRVSLGMATESEEEYRLMATEIQAMTAQHKYFPRLTLLLNKPSASAVDRDARHHLDPEAQTARRSYIAQLRNMLTFHSLQSESHVLWLDADVDYLSPNVIQTMLAHQYSNPKAGLITARCQEGPTFDYDKNAWSGVRYQQGDARVDTRRNVAELIRGTSSNDLIPLSSVGGTVLLIRSSLVSRGLVFPTTPVIGAEWNKTGWDGIETEGLCVLARGLGDASEGVGCFALGGSHFVGHVNY